jgi:hypothetical protein
MLKREVLPPSTLLSRCAKLFVIFFAPACGMLPAYPVALMVYSGEEILKLNAMLGDEGLHSQRRIHP